MNGRHLLAGLLLVACAIMAEVCQVEQIVLFEQEPFRASGKQEILTGLTLVRAVSIFTVVCFDLVLRHMHSVAMVLLCVFAWPCLCKLNSRDKGESSGSDADPIRDNQVVPRDRDVEASPSQLISVIPEAEVFEQ